MTELDTLVAFYRALEEGVHGTALERYWTDDVTTIEHPNLLVPTGGSHDLAEMVAGSDRGAGLLASQRYDVIESHEVGDTAIARVTWTAEIAHDIGPFREGQQLTAHLAQFATVRDGKIARLVTYDCYEPFGATGAT